MDAASEARERRMAELVEDLAAQRVERIQRGVAEALRPYHEFRDRLAAPNAVRTAYHEGGHAVLETVTGGEVISASVTPETVVYCRPVDLATAPRDEVRRVTVALLGGAAANWLRAGESDWADTSLDLTTAIVGAKSLGYAGEAVTTFLADCLGEAIDLLQDRWEAVETVAGRLLAHGHLDGAEVARLVGTKMGRAAKSALVRRSMHSAGHYVLSKHHGLPLGAMVPPCPDPASSAGLSPAQIDLAVQSLLAGPLAEARFRGQAYPTWPEHRSDLDAVYGLAQRAGAGGEGRSSYLVEQTELASRLVDMLWPAIERLGTLLVGTDGPVSAEDAAYAIRMAAG